MKKQKPTHVFGYKLSEDAPVRQFIDLSKLGDYGPDPLWMKLRSNGEYFPERHNNMDPNETLKEIRHLLIAAHGGIVDPEGEADRYGRLAELVEALDQWLASGGFLPHAWTATKKVYSNDRPIQEDK